MRPILISSLYCHRFVVSVDEWQQKQIHDEISRRSVRAKSFGVYAKQQQDILKYQIETHLDQTEILEEQLHHIEGILERQTIIRRQQNLVNSME